MPCARRASAAPRSACRCCRPDRRAVCSPWSTSSSTASDANAIETQRLGVWWANRMLVTARPLEEKLTLFWHGHFATGDVKVRDYRMMLRQNEMLRARASGELRACWSGSCRTRRCSSISTTARTSRSTPTRTSDASCSSCSRWASATTRSVTCARRRAHSPAGRTMSSRSSSTREQHDFGDKTFLGRTGPLDGTDIIDAILAQPVTAEFVAAKLYRFFVRETMSPRGQSRSSAARFRVERLSDEAAAETDVPVEGLLQRARPSRHRSRVR